MLWHYCCTYFYCVTCMSCVTLNKIHRESKERYTNNKHFYYSMFFWMFFTYLYIVCSILYHIYPCHVCDLCKLVNWQVLSSRAKMLAHYLSRLPRSMANADKGYSIWDPEGAERKKLVNVELAWSDIGQNYWMVFRSFDWYWSTLDKWSTESRFMPFTHLLILKWNLVLL